jgi:hypothetical protein
VLAEHGGSNSKVAKALIAEVGSDLAAVGGTVDRSRAIGTGLALGGIGGVVGTAAGIATTTGRLSKPTIDVNHHAEIVHKDEAAVDRVGREAEAAGSALGKGVGAVGSGLGNAWNFVTGKD